MVPPFGFQELRGWLVDDSTIMATSHEAYSCAPGDPSEWVLECPCSNQVTLMRVELAV